MVVELKDTATTVFHEEFQRWRKQHPSGIFLTLETKSKANLHGTQCQHLGSMEWLVEDGTGSNSLTKKLKALDDGLDSLNEWARRRSVTIHPCLHCLRDKLIDKSFFVEELPSSQLAESFQAWLIESGTTEKTAKNYSGAIAGRLKDLAMQLRNVEFIPSQIDSAENFKNFCNLHDRSQEILALNARGKDMYRRALVWYSKYLENQSTTVPDHGIEADFREKVVRSVKDSASARAKRLATSERTPRTISVTTVVFVRNPDVVAQVLIDADGHCQECKKVASFNRKSDSTPYLEVHHRIPLAMGGDDSISNAIALCPNCHRKMHFGI